MKNRLKKRKIAAVVLALVLLAAVVWVIDMLTGYPISCFVVNHAVSRYLSETYPELSLEHDWPDRTLKLGGFQVSVHCPGSQDTHFFLQADGDGTIQSDGYEDGVKNGVNTLYRFSRLYNKACEKALADAGLSEEILVTGDFLTAFENNNAPSNEPGANPLPLDAKTLEKDGEPDLAALGAKHGCVTLSVETNEPTAEIAADCLLKVRAAFEKANLAFYSAEFWTVSPGEQGAKKKEFRILNFAWDDIYEEGLEDRLNAAREETEAYYQ